MRECIGTNHPILLSLLAHFVYGWKQGDRLSPTWDVPPAGVAPSMTAAFLAQASTRSDKNGDWQKVSAGVEGGRGGRPERRSLLADPAFVSCECIRGVVRRDMAAEIPSEREESQR